MNIPENPYLLLTPGPLSTTKTVKAAMLRDWCTWDDDYNSLVQEIRAELLQLAGVNQTEYTSVLMQGSGTFAVESVIGTALRDTDKLLVLTNGAYGERIATIAGYLKIDFLIYDAGELDRHDPDTIDTILVNDKTITHVAVVHCETTTGMLNQIEVLAEVVKKHSRIFIVDAMSSFGGIPIEMEKLGIGYLISSSNKCIQGVPGFGFVIARKSLIENCGGNARSLSLDLFDQWQTMEKGNGKWRFTSPTHVVRAFSQALKELRDEGSTEARYLRYSTNQQTLVNGMRKLGFQTLLSDELQSPIITTFISPESSEFDFLKFYNLLKNRGFVIYPGKVTDFQCFRIGNIGDIYPSDIELLIITIENSIYWK
jgi:2-aminoethylphosphonate-pyruvate transaminase